MLKGKVTGSDCVASELVARKVAVRESVCYAKHVSEM